MLRRLLFGLGAFLIAGPVFAQAPAKTFDASTGCPLSCLELNVAGMGTATVQVTGSGTYTLVVEGAAAGAAGYQTKAIAPFAGGAHVTSITAPGGWTVDVAGLEFLQVRKSAGSGTPTVYLRAALGGGGGTSGGDATEATLDDIAGDIATIADGLAQESVHGNAVIATFAGIGGEAKDFDLSALPNLVTEGQANRIATTLSGGVFTFPTNEAGTATPISADDAAFANSFGVSAVGFLADEASTDSVDENDIGAARMTLDRKVITTPQPHTAGGLSIYRSIDLDEGTGEVVKASAGQLYALWVTNTATATRFVKVYDATSCTMGTGTPVITAAVPGNASDDVMAALTGGGYGITFATGICFGATTGVADADTGAPGANDVIANAFYK